MKQPRLHSGDIIRVCRGIYYHYGVYVGGRRVVHFSAPKGIHEMDPLMADIREVSLSDFSKGETITVDNRYEAKFPSTEIVDRARKMIGTQLGRYDLYGNNCEHFANWCKTGDTKSHQSKVVSSIIKEFSSTLGGVANAFEEIRSDMGRRCYDDILAGKGDARRLDCISLFEIIA